MIAICFASTLRRCLMGLLLMMCLVPAMARAQTIASNFAASAPLYSTTGTGFGESSGIVFDIAAPFVPAANAQLGSVDLPLGALSNENVRVQIRSDSAGKPGTILDFVDRVLTSPSHSIINFDFSAAGIAFTAGQTYWVSIKHLDALPDDANNMIGSWALNNTGQTGYASSTNGGSNWSSQSGTTQAFRINAVPEPGMIGLFGLAAAALLPRRRRPGI